MIDYSVFNGKRVAFFTLGCKLNFAETSTLGETLMSYGVTKAKKGEVADICIVNTCTVTAMADSKCRQAIHKIIKDHPGALVAVTGCYAQLQPQLISDIPGVNIVVGAQQRSDLIDQICYQLQTHPLTPPCMEGSGHHEALPSDGNYSPPSQGGAQGESLFFEYAGASGGFIDRYGYPYCRGRVFDTIEEDKGQYDDIASVMWTTGAAMMVRSDIYWKAGGLDALFFAHMEEIDLCWRMRIMGYELACIPQSTAYHLGGATLNQGNPRKTFLNFRNNLLMLYKNLPDSKLTSVLRMRTLLDWVAAIQFLVKGDPQNMKAIFKAHKEFKLLKPQYATIRQQIQAYRTSIASQPETSDFSLLWQYYVKGRKTYKALHLINIK